MGAQHLRRACRVLRAGGVIAYPTEAVFGLGCDPGCEEALARVLALKGRSPRKGMILVAADWGQLTPFLAPLPPEARRRVEGSWPGFVTWLLPARSGLSRSLTGGGPLVAARITAYHPLVSLCRTYGGPIVSTSANRSGCRPARTALQVRRIFGDQLDYILPGPVGGEARPSPIRHYSDGKLLRV